MSLKLGDTVKYVDLPLGSFFRIVGHFYNGVLRLKTEEGAYNFDGDSDAPESEEDLVIYIGSMEQLDETLDDHLNK